MGRTLLRNGLHLFALSGFAIARPLYDLIESDVSSLVVDDVTGGALVVMGLLLMLLPPLLLLAVEALVAWVKEDWLEWVHLAFVAGLVALFVLAARWTVDLLPDTFPMLAPIGLVLGVAAAWLYRRAEVVRTYLSVLAVAPVLFFALFVFSGAASPLMLDVDVPASRPSAEGVTAPVVMIVLDELPLSSLLDRKGEIDAARYPNFARFAEDATWFRNTVSIEAFTPWAVPAILDGKRPRQKAYSHPAFHPDSLFTLLGDTHEMHVREAFTRVCPERLCPRGDGNFVVRGVRGVDGLVYPFWAKLVPGRPAEYLADATQAVRGLLGAETTRTVPGANLTLAEVRAVLDERMPSFEAFLGDLERGDRPGLFYEHLLLPHAPFEFQREGEYSMFGERLQDDVWDADPSLTRLGWRRHLVQLEYTDRLLGRVLDRLEASGLYDDAAVVLVADHGAVFEPGGNRRAPNAKTLPHLAPVPFLLKAPGQTEGRVSDVPGETIDVLPTLADALGVSLPWKADGVSLLSGSAGAERDEVAMTIRGGSRATRVPRSTMEFGLPGMRARFPVGGEGKDRRRLFAEDGYDQLIGAALPEAPAARVELRKTLAPRLSLQGTVTGASGRPVLAIGRCGRVAGVARAYPAGGELRFAALLDPSVPGDCPPEVRVIG